jgi:hypothetical protein
MRFIKGDSEKVNKLLGAKSVDYVIDVQNSMFYPDQKAYFRAVREVLKDDGLFFFCDCRAFPEV